MDHQSQTANRRNCFDLLWTNKTTVSILPFSCRIYALTPCLPSNTSTKEIMHIPIMTQFLISQQEKKPILVSDFFINSGELHEQLLSNKIEIILAKILNLSLSLSLSHVYLHGFSKSWSSIASYHIVPPFLCTYLCAIGTVCSRAHTVAIQIMDRQD
jgi:hypothetical protein